MHIILIGDCHHPWMDWKLFRKIVKRIKDVQPTHVIQMGDLLDLYTFSRYPRNLSFATPKWELTQGRKDAEKMWDAVRDAAPKAKLHQLLGNHDTRILKQVRSRFAEVEALLDHLNVNSLWEFEGVVTQKSEAHELVLGDICFQHGHKTKLGDHMLSNLMNTVVGHSHHGGVVYRRFKGKALWELNAGAIPDMNAEPLAYGLNKTLYKSVLGYGEIDEHGPRFISL